MVRHPLSAPKPSTATYARGEPRGEPAWLLIAVAFVLALDFSLDAASDVVWRTVKLDTWCHHVVGARRGAARRHGTSLRWQGLILGLGVTFLAIQGSDWVQLVRFGLRLSSGVYDGILYALIGMHAVPVVVAVLVLGTVSWRARAAMYSVARRTDIEVGPSIGFSW